MMTLSPSWKITDPATGTSAPTATASGVSVRARCRTWSRVVPQSPQSPRNALALSPTRAYGGSAASFPTLPPPITVSSSKRAEPPLGSIFMGLRRRGRPEITIKCATGPSPKPPVRLNEAKVEYSLIQYQQQKCNRIARVFPITKASDMRLATLAEKCAKQRPPRGFLAAGLGAFTGRTYPCWSEA
jgi:hypothetical protein